MRIISSFRDYYDSGIAYGIDPDLLYVRETRVQKIDNKNPMGKHLHELQNAFGTLAEFEGHKGVIAFCGKLYPFYEVNTDSMPGFCFSYNKTFFSFKEMQDAFNEEYQDKILFCLKQKLKILKLCEVKSVESFVKTIRAHIKELTKPNRYWSKMKLAPIEHDQTYIGKRVSDDMFRAEKSPIIMVDSFDRLNKAVTVNPRLQDYGFASVMDPVTAFQELSAFLGSNLVEQKDPNPPMSDELKSEIHGFDKWSFRKPGKKSI
ncbi:MAG TPA: hypothetical protein VMV86_04310 [Methanosarcinales archaeon]|nr:hypothetical protein [Methanosarcinales archaeon]